MKHPACEKTREALRQPGAKPGIDQEIAAHAASCPSCAETLKVSAWLQSAARQTAPRHGLQSASQLWWRAQIIHDLVEKETLAERITRPTRWMQGTGLVLLCLLVTLFLTWQTSTLLAGLEPNASIDWTATGWRWLFGLLVAGTALPLAGFTALWIWWRDA